MDVLLLPARMLLAAVFAAAGTAKLVDLRSSRAAITGFGAPSWLAQPLGTLLPLSELAVAVVLVPVGSAWWGGLGALVLLLGFIGAITVNLAQGRTPDCRCFGQVHSRPTGWSTLARNAALALCAGLIVWAGRGNSGNSVVTWLTLTNGPRAGTVTLVCFAALVGEAWLLFHILQQHGRLLLRMDALERRLGETFDPGVPVRSPYGLPLGAPAPPFTLRALAGPPAVGLDSIREAHKPVLLIFADPDCRPCAALWPDVGRWQRTHGSKMRIAVVSRGSDQANRLPADEHGLTDVLLQEGAEVADAYRVGGTPAAVLIRPDAAIGSHVVLGPEAIADLVARIANGSSGSGAARENGHDGPGPMTAVWGLPIGAAAPVVRLPDASGRTIALSDFTGRRMLVLLWNPACASCGELLAELKRRERDQPTGTPDLIVVSTGTVEATRVLGFQSTVLIDSESSVASKFRAGPMPTALLIDADGTIASELAVGMDGILALAGWGGGAQTGLTKSRL